MEVRFCIQDPTYEETTYLYEAILKAVGGAVSWRGVYAFASQAGVSQLIDDPLVHKCINEGCDIEMLVGIDAVTNRQALERLQELERNSRSRFRPRVFWNSGPGLFHPKMSEFRYGDGRQTMIVGSGNLTPGGLRNNFEGFTILSGRPNEELDVSALDEFLVRHARNIRSIDEEALKRAAENLRPPTQGAWRPGGVKPTGWKSGGRQSMRLTVHGRERILAARVPKAGGRWAQAHFNADIVRDYFRITDFNSQRAYLTHVDEAGNRGELEVRRCVYSVHNKNHKIEIKAAKDKDYPDTGTPILIFRERQMRTFDYMLLMPGDRGHAQMMKLTESQPSVGRGFRRIMTDMDTLSRKWKHSPLVDSPEPDEPEN